MGSDTPFFIALGILGGVYVLLLVAMLVADFAYTLTPSERLDTTVAVQLSAVSDPAILKVPAGVTVARGKELVFTTASGNAIKITGVRARESFPAKMKVRLVVNNGSLILGSKKNVTITGNDSNAVTLEGAVRDVNKALDGLKYLTAQSGSATDTLSVLLENQLLRAEVGLRVTSEGKDIEQGQMLVDEAVVSFDSESGNGITVAGPNEKLRVSLSVLKGTLSVPSVSDVELTGNGTKSLIVKGGRSDVNRALAKLEYHFSGRLAQMLATLTTPEIKYSIKLTLISCTITMILSLWVAVPIGYMMARHTFPGKRFLDALLDIPIVLPPLVIGLSLLILFRTKLGVAFHELLASAISLLPFVPESYRFSIYYSIPAVILAQFMVACAFAVRTMVATFQQINPRQEQVALTLGCTRSQAFWGVVLPEARPGLLTAATLAWARAMGEFGPILIFAGATRFRTEVLPTTVFLEMSVGNLEAAVAVSLLMVVTAIVVLIIVRIYGVHPLMAGRAKS